MHPNSETAVQGFLAETRKISDPKQRLERLESSEFSEQPAIKAAIAWWAARYHFTDKKKTRTGDRFLWFLLNLKSWANNVPTVKEKQVVAAYKEAFLSSEVEQAIALDNRIEEEMLDACVLYLETIDTNPGFLGFKIGKAPDKSDTLKRVAAIVTRDLIAGVYAGCASLKHSDVLVRCLWKGAEQTNPGIAGTIEAMVREYDSEQMRDFVLRAVN